jgi:hypothetical protein
LSGFLIFLPGDIIKCLLSAALAKRLSKITGKNGYTDYKNTEKLNRIIGNEDYDMNHKNVGELSEISDNENYNICYKNDEKSSEIIDRENYNINCKNSEKLN